MIAILPLQDELDTRDTEMNDAEDTRKPHSTSGTFTSLSYAMVVDDVPLCAESDVLPTIVVATFPEADVVITRSTKSADVVLTAPHSFEDDDVHPAVANTAVILSARVPHGALVPTP